MTLPEITALYRAERLDTLYQKGIFLAKRGSGNNSVFLFQLEGWYVEIYYSIYRREVKEIVISKNLQILDPYLEEISIEEIFNLAR